MPAGVLTPNWNKVEVRGRYVGIDGLPMSGRILFTPQANRMVDNAALITIVGRAIAVQLDANGAFSVWLPATDDPDITGNGFTYMVKEEFVNGLSYAIDVPLARIEWGIDLATYANVPPSDGLEPGAIFRAEFDNLLATIGQPGGLAKLDDDGYVPVPQVLPYLRPPTPKVVLDFDGERLTTVDEFDADGTTLLQSTTLHYEPSGRLSSYTETVDGVPTLWNLNYDSLGLLVGYERSDA